MMIMSHFVLIVIILMRLFCFSLTEAPSISSLMRWSLTVPRTIHPAVCDGVTWIWSHGDCAITFTLPSNSKMCSRFSVTNSMPWHWHAITQAKIAPTNISKQNHHYHGSLHNWHLFVKYNCWFSSKVQSSNAANTQFALLFAKPILVKCQFNGI